ncbi:RNA-binding protein [Candidatus Woesearchaeota archaeon]|nr:RNA-binding protein [Candidatus Woesearchaeota archaeon]
MGKLNVKEREICVPGQVLAEGMDYIPSDYTFRDKEDIIASQLGLINIEGRAIKVIPLVGKYNPQAGDLVIGKIIDMSMSNWFVDIGFMYDAGLSIREVPEFIDRGADLTQYYGFNDVVLAKVVNVVRSKMVDLSMKGPGLFKLRGGRIVKITPFKVPRVIGKQGSMITMIKDKTHCKIIVGQNGMIWINGEDFKSEDVAIRAIKMIDKFSHTEGLTDKVNKFLDEEMKNGIQ